MLPSMIVIFAVFPASSWCLIPIQLHWSLNPKVLEVHFLYIHLCCYLRAFRLLEIGDSYDEEWYEEAYFSLARIKTVIQSRDT